MALVRSVPVGFRTLSVRARQAAILWGSIPIASAAHAAPLQYLSGAGEKAAPVVGLTWGVLGISVAVIVIVGLLLTGAIWHRPGRALAVGQRAALERDQGGLNWLWIGVGLSTLALLFTLVWTVKVLADIQAPPAKPAVTIEVTGRQWWWQVRYIAGDTDRSFVTANEIHIPAGVPVRLKLVGGDVIHSFWVPQLAGKMDAIPGLTNETWIQAAAPGTYLGQCTEYCGLQHARMGLRVIAQAPSDFRAWWAHELAAPAEPQSASAQAGARQFQSHCGGCHTVRGTDAAGALGPDLSHLMQRRTIASGMLPNDAPDLAHWVADPQGVKPGCLMPTPALSGDDLIHVTAYLRSLT